MMINIILLIVFGCVALYIAEYSGMKLSTYYATKLQISKIMILNIAILDLIFKCMVEVPLLTMVYLKLGHLSILGSITFAIIISLLTAYTNINMIYRLNSSLKLLNITNDEDVIEFLTNESAKVKDALKHKPNPKDD